MFFMNIYYAPALSGMEEVPGRFIPQQNFSYKLLHDSLIQHGVHHLDETRDIDPAVERRSYLPTLPL